MRSRNSILLLGFLLAVSTQGCSTPSPKGSANINEIWPASYDEKGAPKQRDIMGQAVNDSKTLYRAYEAKPDAVLSAIIESASRLKYDRVLMKYSDVVVVYPSHLQAKAFFTGYAIPDRLYILWRAEGDGTRVDCLLFHPPGWTSEDDAVRLCGRLLDGISDVLNEESNRTLPSATSH